MPEARGRRPEADPGSRSSDPSSQESQPRDPKLHAATLLGQADLLTQLARELQHEARRRSRGAYASAGSRPRVSVRAGSPQRWRRSRTICRSPTARA